MLYITCYPTIRHEISQYTKLLIYLMIEKLCVGICRYEFEYKVVNDKK